MAFHACSSEVNDAILSLRKAIDVVTIQQITPLQQLSENAGIPLTNNNNNSKKEQKQPRVITNNNNSNQHGQPQLLIPPTLTGLTSHHTSGTDVDVDVMELSGGAAALSSSAIVPTNLSPITKQPPTTLGSLMLPPQRHASSSSLLSDRNSNYGGGNSTTAPAGNGLRKAVSRKSSMTALSNASFASQKAQQQQQQQTQQQQFQNQISSDTHLENHKLLSGALDNLVAALEDQTMLMFKHLQPEEYEAKRRAKGESALKDKTKKKKRHHQKDKEESTPYRRRSHSKKKRHRRKKSRRRSSGTSGAASSLLDDDDDESDSSSDASSRHNTTTTDNNTVKKQVSIMGRHLDEVDVDPITGEIIRKDYPTNGKYSSSSGDDDDDESSSWDCTSDTSTSNSSAVSSVVKKKKRSGKKEKSQKSDATSTSPLVAFAKHETTELTQLAEVLFTNPVHDAASIIEKGGLEGRAALQGEKARARQAINKLSMEDADRDAAGSKKAASECRKAHLDAKRKQRALERKALEAVREEDKEASLRSGGTNNNSSKRRVESELEGITPTAFGQRRAEAEQLSKLKRKMEGDRHGKATTGTYAGQLHTHPSDKAVLEALSVNFSCALQSCAHFLQAARARLYIPHHRTKTMKLVAACPDSSVVVLRGGQFIARNQGLPGAAASSGIAISIDNVTDDIRRNYLSSSYHGDTVESIFVMPIHNPNRRKKSSSGGGVGCDDDDGAPEVIGVMEFINKSSGQHWSEFDENMAYHTATLLSHFITSFGHGLLDLHQMPAFQLNVFHSVVPYTPAPTHTDLHTLNPPKDSEIIAQAMKVAAAEQQELQRRETTAAATIARGGAASKRNTVLGNNRQQSTTTTTTGRRLSFEAPSSGGGVGLPGAASRKHTVTMLPPPGTPPNISHHHPNNNNDGTAAGYNPFSSTPLQRNLRTMLFRPQGEAASVFRKPVLIARVTDLSDVPSVGGSGISAPEGGDPSELFVAVPQGVFDTVDEEEVYKKRVRAAKKHASRIGEIGSVRYVREMSAYLTSLEDTSRTTMDDLVTTRTKVNSKVDEILDLTGRIKVLENNCQYLNERLIAAQRQHLDRTASGGVQQRQQSPPRSGAESPLQQPTSPTSPQRGGLTFVTSSPTSQMPAPGASPSTAVTASSSMLFSSQNRSRKHPIHQPPNTTTTLPSPSSSPSIPTDAVTLRAFLQQASLAADELKREALHLPALLKNKGGGGSNNLRGGGGVATSSSTEMYTSSPYFTPSEHKSVFESVSSKRKKAATPGGQLQTPGFRGSGTGGATSSPHPLRSKSALM